MIESGKASLGGDGARAIPERKEGQATLSAIGDVSVAATAAVGQVAAAPRRTRWLPILGFLLFAYITGSGVAIYTHLSKPWVQVFVAPLVLTLIAVLAFWRRQVWKFRAINWKFREKTQRDALNSLAHETANGLNAARANLAGFEEESSSADAAEHRKLVEQALKRIEAALVKATAQAQPNADSGCKPAPAAPNSKAA